MKKLLERSIEKAQGGEDLTEDEIKILLGLLDTEDEKYATGETVALVHWRLSRLGIPFPAIASMSPEEKVESILKGRYTQLKNSKPLEAIS